MAINILDEMKKDFLVYCGEVNGNRAFPDVRDGLKPGMRATLWEMYTKGYSSNKPHVKSAKVSGGTIATWWPHGDSSIYEVVVRMSQPWINNICEIDFHGANGSLLGGPNAASSRYTECRLSRQSEDGFFSNIKKDVVDMIDNFSEDEKWPSVFPALFPRLLINGSSGIGYTIAQDWLPHNLNEVFEKIKEYIASGKVSTENIYPDFPIGGTIINKKDLHTIYETGRGSVILRGKVNISGKYINITELPYQVYAEAFIQKIKDLVNAGTISGIDDICNKSDDDGLLIEIECSDNPESVLNKLYKLTDLQITLSANQMALVDGVPQMLTLADYIKVYVNHNIKCLVREYKYDLNKAVARLEIVDGLLKALSIIDKVIVAIKASKSAEVAKEDLINNFSFTKNQAQAIIDMRLGRLANLEQNELTKEKAELEKIIDKCNKLITSDKLQKKEFINRLSDFVAEYGWQRKTEVIDIDLAAEKEKAKNSSTADEKVIIFMTKCGEIKRIDSSDFKPDKVNNENNKVITSISIGMKDRFIAVTDAGNMYKLCVKDIPLSNMNAAGKNISSMINNEKLIRIFDPTLDENGHIFMITKSGLGKRMKIKDAFYISKNVGASIIKLDEDDALIHIQIIADENIEITFDKKKHKIDLSKFSTKGRFAGGQKCIKIKKNQKLDLWSEN